VLLLHSPDPLELVRFDYWRVRQGDGQALEIKDAAHGQVTSDDLIIVDVMWIEGCHDGNPTGIDGQMHICGISADHGYG
jgi:hypothetical protein